MAELTDEEFDTSHVTEQNIRDFLAEKVVPLTCRECNHGEVALAVTRGHGRVPSILSMNEGSPEIFRAWVDFYFQLICKNCGHMRMFERAHVARWLTEKRP